MKTTTTQATQEGSGPLSKMGKPALMKANELMKRYKQCVEQKQELQASIADQLKSVTEVMKELEENLILMGERHKLAFDEKGNFHLEDGYLHIANSTVVKHNKKFDVTQFTEAFPDLIEVKLKTSLVKKEWLSTEGNKALRNQGVSVDTVESMQVIVNKDLE